MMTYKTRLLWSTAVACLCLAIPPLLLRSAGLPMVPSSLSVCNVLPFACYILHDPPLVSSPLPLIPVA